MSINNQNYEEWMVAFLDGELTDAEQVEFNDFIEKNPALKEELAAYESVQFTAEEKIIIENKETLYKRESTFVLLKKAWPIAAAIILLLGVIPFLKKDGTEAPKTVVQKQSNNINSPIVKQVPAVVAETITEEPSQPTVTTNPIKGNQLQQPARRALNPQPIVSSQKKNLIKREVPEPVTPVVNKLTPQQYVKEEVQNEESQPLEKVQKEKSTVAIENNEQIIEPPKQPKAVDVDSEEKSAGFVVISEASTPILHQKLNEVVTKVEDRIETIKKIKNSPITVCLGKRKLFTLNN